MKRATAGRLIELAGELSERDRQIIELVGARRLMSSGQIERVCFASGESPETLARLARRVLARLVERGVLGRLERRIGGVRAGAAGHVYYLAAAGQRLIAFWRGEGLRRTRSPHEPNGVFVRHALCVSACFVSLVELARTDAARLREFEGEPGCWQRYPGPGGVMLVLKPDARVVLDVGDGEEEHIFLEVDCGTEGRRVLERKCRAYLAAYNTGSIAPVFPRVVWVTTTARRVELLREVCGQMPAEAWKLFTVTTPEHLPGLLAGTLPQTGGQP